MPWNYFKLILHIVSIAIIVDAARKLRWNGKEAAIRQICYNKIKSRWMLMIIGILIFILRLAILLFWGAFWMKSWVQAERELSKYAFVFYFAFSGTSFLAFRRLFHFVIIQIDDVLIILMFLWFGNIKSAEINC